MQYYAPDEGNMLTLSQKKDLNFSGSVPSSVILGDDNFEQFNFQLGYSPIKHLGIFSSYFNYSNKGYTLSKDSKIKLPSLAIGGYYLIQSKKQKIRSDTTNNLPAGILLDLYSWYGKGQLTNNFEDGGNSTLDFHKYFIQGGIHWQDEIVGINTTYKFGGTNYFQGIINGPFTDEDNKNLRNIVDNNTFLFREFSFKFYVGARGFRTYAGFTNLNFFDKNPFNHRKQIRYLGIVFDIDTLYKIIKNKEKITF